MTADNEKLTRQDIDDVYKRNNANNSYKNRAFEGKRTAIDEYTGEKIYYSDKSVNGVKRHFKTTSTSNIDHVTPVDRLIERYGNDLKAEQIKKMANSDYNLANTNEALNKSKGAMTNLEYLKDKRQKGEPESLNTTVRMLHKEAISEVNLAADSTRYRVKNKIEPVTEKVSGYGADAKQVYYNFVGNTYNPLPQTAIKLGNDFSEGALAALQLNAAGIPILVEGATNAIQVLSGEMDAKEAATDMIKITSAVAVSGGATRAVTNIATDLLQHSGNKSLQNIAASNQVAQIVGISMMLKDSFIDWINGDIDGEEFLNQVNEKAIGLVANYATTIIVGSGGAALIPALVAMVVSTACVEIYKNIQNAKLRAELSEREWNRKYYALERLAQEAIIELSQQKEQLKNMMDYQFTDWEKSFESGFLRIFNAIQDSDNTSEEITAGLQEILDVFDKNVAFRTQQEFDKALFDEDFVFVL